MISRIEYRYRDGQGYRKVEGEDAWEVIPSPAEEQGAPPKDATQTLWVGEEEHRLRHDSLGRLESRQVYLAGVLQYALDYLPRIGPEPIAKTVFRYTPAGLLRKIYYYDCIGQGDTLKSVVTYQYRFY